MKRAFLYTGGELFAEGVTERPGADDLILAADAGYRAALRFGQRPAVVLGDFDSLAVR